MSLANQYSYLLISGIGIIVILFTLRMMRVRWQVIAASGLALVLTSAGIWVALRPGGSDINSVEEADALLTNGRPTMVEFFSNYCAGCISVRPQVDSLISNIRDVYDDSFNVMRVDIHTTFGRTLRERYGFSYTPEFVVFDPAGVEIWRGHVPPSMDTLAQASASQS